jgi:hypothetical protein
MQFVFDEILIIVTFSQVQHTRTDDKFELKGVFSGLLDQIRWKYTVTRHYTELARTRATQVR